MPNKYYTLLYTKEGNEMMFPIKGVKNAFDQQVQFAGGYPAIFGGTDTGGADATLIAEVTEESRGTLLAAAPFKKYFQGAKPNDNLFFYWNAAWKITAKKWGPPANRDEGEMSGVRTVSINEFSSKDPPDTVLTKLIALSGARGGSAAQKKEFLESETAVAFVRFIYASCPLKTTKGKTKKSAKKAAKKTVKRSK
jgi:hypothetical protein